MLHAKKTAKDHAAAIQHLNEAAENIRRAAKFREHGDYEQAVYYITLAHAHGKYAKKYHDSGHKLPLNITPGFKVVIPYTLL